MEDELDSLGVHPPGVLEWLGVAGAAESHLETYGSRVPVEWDPSAKVTAFGPLSYFIHVLKTSGLWVGWVALRPLRFASDNAPSKRRLLGTVLLPPRRTQALCGGRWAARWREARENGSLGVERFRCG
jgi:hypothetical protein